MSDPSIRLVIQTSDGTFVRSVQPAAVLPEGVPVGYAAEDATRDAAAFWGLPDFIFRSGLHTRGSATREAGDAIVVVGPTAASVQVKARESPTSDETKERAWLDKKIRKAASQARGTIRKLKSQEGMTLTNERGRQILIKGGAKTWLPVVVLDHPGVAGYASFPTCRRPVTRPRSSASSRVNRLSANLRKISPRTGIEYSAPLRWELARSSSAVSHNRLAMSWMSVATVVPVLLAFVTMSPGFPAPDQPP